MKTLDSQSAFKPGCDLWLVADLAHSKWARKVDWYLNFQFKRAQPHITPVASEPLQQILETWDLESPKIRLASEAPLMVASESLLPNRQTVLIPFKGDQAKWVRDCHRVWSDLGRPNLRVFLPDSLRPDLFEVEWPKVDHPVELELVP